MKIVAGVALLLVGGSIALPSGELDEASAVALRTPRRSRAGRRRCTRCAAHEETTSRNHRPGESLGFDGAELGRREVVGGSGGRRPASQPSLGFDPTVSSSPRTAATRIGSAL